MKKRTSVLISLLGLTLLLSACGAPVAQQTSPSSVSDTLTQSASASVSDEYIQVYIDPKTGNLVTINPKTGETKPYEAPTTKNDSAALPVAATNSSETPASGSTTTVNQSSLQNQNPPSAASYIGEEKAISIAIQHSGVASSEVLFSLAKLDHDNGRYEYDVEFYAVNKEYDYNIDAITGTILNFDYDMESHFTPPAQSQTASAAKSNTQSQTAAPAQPAAQPAPQPAAQPAPQPAAQPAPQPAAQPAPQPAPQPASVVSIDTARQTALSRVPGATANHIRIVTDYDDGRMVYDGKIIYNNMEYDFEIDANTGNVTEWDVDSIYD